MGKNEIAGRSLPKRTGPAGAAATALTKVLVARTQAGPIRYANTAGGEYCTLAYLAVGVEQPHNVKQIIAPLLSQGARVTHGTTHEPLQGWNMVVDVSKTREETMALPQRIDFINDCLHLEKVTKNTVLLCFYTGVTPDMDVMNIINQVTRSINRFHIILVCMKTLDPLSSWTPGAAQAPTGRGRGGGVVNSPKVTEARSGGQGKSARGTGRGGGRGTTGGRGANRALPVGTPSLGRGGGRGASKGATGRVAGAPAAGGKGGKAGGKGGKGGKSVKLGDGLTKSIRKDGTLSFNYRPY